MNTKTFAAITNVAILAFIAFMVCTGHSPWWALVLVFMHSVSSGEK